MALWKTALAKVFLIIWAASGYTWGLALSTFHCLWQSCHLVSTCSDLCLWGCWGLAAGWYTWYHHLGHQSGRSFSRDPNIHPLKGKSTKNDSVLFLQYHIWLVFYCKLRPYWVIVWSIVAWIFSHSDEHSIFGLKFIWGGIGNISSYKLHSQMQAI